MPGSKPGALPLGDTPPTKGFATADEMVREEGLEPTRTGART